MQTADVINQLAAFPSKRAHSEDVHEAARSEVLSKLPPRQVLNLFYSRKLSLQRPAVVTGIRSRFNTRKELLTWVYREPRKADSGFTVGGLRAKAIRLDHAAIASRLRVSPRILSGESSLESSTPVDRPLPARFNSQRQVWPP